MSELIIQNLVKSYGKTRILSGFSLEVKAGEFLSLLGPSGSGKTTILRCVAGLEKPDPESGEIRLRDRKLSGPGYFMEPEGRRLGMVFQNYAVWPHMTVFENVAFPLRIQARRGSHSAEELETRTIEALERVRMVDKKRSYPGELSGGQQQRVALARALAMSPELLLLDEPLSNLDAILREELGTEIRRLQRALNLTTILVTHDQKEALSLSDRIVLLNQGRIDAQGTPEKLYADPPSAFSAEFLAGAQKLRSPHGEVRSFLPRKWEVFSRESSEAPSGAALWPAEMTTRIFLGSEYEYRAHVEEFSAEVRLFSPERFEPGMKVVLQYRG